MNLTKAITLNTSKW